MVDINKLNQNYGQSLSSDVQYPNIGVEQDQYKDERQRCIAKGGTWDEITQTCILPQQKVVDATSPNAKSIPLPGTQPQIQQNQKLSPGDKLRAEREGGVIITDANGNEIIQTREDVERAKADAASIGPSALQARQARIAGEERLAGLTSQIGQVGTIDPVQEAKVNKSQAFVAGLARAIPGLLGGLAAGAIGGAAVGGVGAIPGAIGGAILGTISGITSGYISNVQAQQRGEIQAANVELQAAKSNMRQFAMMASQDPARAEEYIELYNAQLTRAYQARQKVKAETSGDLNSWMEDGTRDLAEYDVFLQPGGRADLYGQRLAISLQQRVPLSVEDFSEEELNQMFGQ